MWEDEIPMEDPEGFETLFNPVLLRKRLEDELIELGFDPTKLDDLYSEFKNGQLTGDPDGFVYTIMASYAYLLTLDDKDESKINSVSERESEWIKNEPIDPKQDTGMDLRLAA